MDRARFGATCFRMGAVFLILCALGHGFDLYQYDHMPGVRGNSFSLYLPVGLIATASLSLMVATRRRRDPALLRSAAMANILWLLPTIAISLSHWGTPGTTLFALSASSNALAFWLLPNDYY